LICLIKAPSTISGTEVIIGSEKEIEFEQNNIERQYLMTQAIEKVAKLDIARDIAIAERKNKARFASEYCNAIGQCGYETIKSPK
jgi:phage anti-repressor protein